MFKTPEGQARYFAAYEATLALWPVPVEPFDLPTRFGSTHVNACGPEGAPALLLLPGAAVSSTMWYPNIAAWSSSYRVYALDIIGEMGKSVSTHPTMQTLDFAAWLDDVFAGLRLDQAHPVGLSLGGYIALKLALALPHRVQKLVLVAPAGLLPVHQTYSLRMLASILLPMPLDYRQRLFFGTPSPYAGPVIRQLMTPSDFRYSIFTPPIFTDEELQQLKPPVILLLGDQEIVYPYKALAGRATRLLPWTRAEIIPGAGHALTLDQPDLVNQRILEFLRDDEAAPQSEIRAGQPG